MPSAYLTPPGEPANPADLTTTKARDVVAGLAAEAFSYTTLVECRKAPACEVVVVDVQVEVGQTTAEDIHSVERLALVFDTQDEAAPRVLTLREDFPWVPHLNLEVQEKPRSLCLFNERYAELKLRLTARSLVDRAREWLRLTARGELHAPDQSLEQFLQATGGTLIVPHALVTEAPEGFGPTLHQLAVSASPLTKVLVANPTNPAERSEQGVPTVMATYKCKPRAHGLIRRAPGTLADLHELLAPGGEDLVGAIRQQLWEWSRSGTSLGSRFALLLLVPLQRVAGGSIERWDRWAFLTGSSLAEIGIAVDTWQLVDGRPGWVAKKDEQRRGQDVQVGLFDVSVTLSRQVAALVSGCRAPVDVAIAAVGCGALGSQVFLNGYRSGFGSWTLIDHDHLLPHNIARHALTSSFDGAAKAFALSCVVGSIFDEKTGPSSIVGDVLKPGDHAEALKSAFSQAGLILDMSTSIAVARVLTRDTDSTARRASLFLNPEGCDLALLMEDAARSQPLDALEMQYYRAILEREELAKHLDRTGNGLRYGQSCRDIAYPLSQELVSVHAGIGARAVRRGFEESDAQLRIWHADSDTGAVVTYSYPTHPVRELSMGQWRLITDEGLLEKLWRLRTERLRNETGGVLLGALDQQRQIAYIVDALPSPPDSEEYPTCYIRGSQGLLRQVEDAGHRTGGQVGYIGEWHSHPGASIVPSSDDARVFSWITEAVSADGQPAIMLIVGQEAIAFFLGSITPSRPPEHLVGGDELVGSPD